jgi:hypothetical protein
VPYKSTAQRGYFNANRKKLEAQGVDVDEWNAASKGRSLPNKVAKKPKKWMQAESSREEHAGTKGSFSSAAARAGKSTAEYAEEKQHAPGKLGKRARLAKAFMGARH